MWWKYLLRQKFERVCDIRVRSVRLSFNLVTDSERVARNFPIDEKVRRAWWSEPGWFPYGSAYKGLPPYEPVVRDGVIYYETQEGLSGYIVLKAENIHKQEHYNEVKHSVWGREQREWSRWVLDREMLRQEIDTCLNEFRTSSVGRALKTIQEGSPNIYKYARAWVTVGRPYQVIKAPGRVFSDFQSEVPVEVHYDQRTAIEWLRDLDEVGG